jgi:hypothetical protein
MEPRKQIAVSILRWSARVWSLVSLTFILLFFVGEFVAEWSTFPGLTSREIIQLLLFPIGVGIGLVVSWRSEGVGGAITVLSFLLFYLVDWLATGTWPRGPYFALLAFPGLLFLLIPMIGATYTPAAGHR